MKKSHKCSLCGQRINNKNLSFNLQENIEDWDHELHKTVIIKTGRVICSNCLVDYIDDTERIPKTQLQIEYRHIGLKSV